jgi:uncharacterized SAM-binding protein YcdF (DUF218 family)
MRVINDITEFIFVRDDPQKSDIIFIPGGSNPEPSELAAGIWHRGFAPLIMPSGLYNTTVGHFPGSKARAEIYNGDYQTEADFMEDVLIKSGVRGDAIIKESRAGERGTYDNAFYSKELTDSLGLNINKAIICCKSFHARRCLMTYACAFPGTEFYICPADIPDKGRNDWFQNDAGINAVMTELRKCGEYFADKIHYYKR